MINRGFSPHYSIHELNVKYTHHFLLNIFLMMVYSSSEASWLGSSFKFFITIINRCHEKVSFE